MLNVAVRWFIVYFRVSRHVLIMISLKATILSEQNIVTLSVAEWLKVIRYVNASSDADKYMFVLRLWASTQVVKNTSYQAFDGLVGESESNLTAVTLRIEQSNGRKVALILPYKPVKRLITGIFNDLCIRPQA